MSAVQERLVDLWSAVDTWRNIKCSSPASPLTPMAQGIVTVPRQTCDGENHLETCAAEIARQELLHVHDRVGREL